MLANIIRNAKKTVGGGGGGIVIDNGDPFYSAVSLLLSMDGTNGSTTFTDSSLNAIAVTAVGNTQISTTQSKYGGASGSRFVIVLDWDRRLSSQSCASEESQEARRNLAKDKEGGWHPRLAARLETARASAGQAQQNRADLWLRDPCWLVPVRTMNVHGECKNP